MSEALFEEWHAYAKILRHDYMAHRSFFRRLRREIENRYDRPLRILDLGCGDVSPVMSLLRAVEVAAYLGIDDSPAALEIAESNLAELDVDWQLRQADIVDALASLDRQFELIIASYSLHHLETPEHKKAALEGCRRLLPANGLLAVIDVFRAVGESRERYLQRWVADARQRYRELQPGELKTVIDHVIARDFPETPGTYRQIGAEAGFRGFRLLERDAPGLNALITMKSARA